MAESDYKVTLKFSENDPDQQEVISILKQKGRKKSVFVTKAVKFYLDNYLGSGNNNNITRAEIKEIVKEILIEMNISTKAVEEDKKTVDVKSVESKPKKSKEISKKEEVPVVEDEPSDEMIDDFLGSLDSWGQEDY